jgi:predicted RNA-binding Zn-ribbon protein involved in translation (DUF1610 family)
MGGWNLPPGVRHSDLPGWHDKEVMHLFECPNCGEVELEVMIDGSVGEQDVESDCIECGATLTSTWDPGEPDYDDYDY